MHDGYNCKAMDRDLLVFGIYANFDTVVPPGEYTKFLVEDQIDNRL